LRVSLFEEFLFLSDPTGLILSAHW